jgi:hypothetical protein
MSQKLLTYTDKRRLPKIEFKLSGVTARLDAATSAPYLSFSLDNYKYGNFSIGTIVHDYHHRASAHAQTAFKGEKIWIDAHFDFDNAGLIVGHFSNVAWLGDAEKVKEFFWHNFKPKGKQKMFYVELEDFKRMGFYKKGNETDKDEYGILEGYWVDEQKFRDKISKANVAWLDKCLVRLEQTQGWAKELLSATREHEFTRQYYMACKKDDYKPWK